MTGFFIELFNMSVTASYLVLAVMVARLLLKRAPRWVSCLLWLLVGLRLICPFSFESSLSLIPDSQPIYVNSSSVGSPFDVQSGVPIIDENVNVIVESNYYGGQTGSSGSASDITEIFAIVWIIGLIAMLLYGLVSYLSLRKRVAPSILFRNNIYYCDNIETPFILGLIRPKIYVSSGIDEEQIFYIALHENAHLKRRDHFWKPLGFILLSVYWFNPVLWVAYILLCRDIEAACDEKVIKDMPDIEKRGYSETLVSCSIQRRRIMVCPLAFGEVGVKQRIKSVLNYKKPALWIVILSLLIFAVIAVCFVSNPVNDKVDRILNEDGFKVISAEDKKVSFCLDSTVLTDEMFAVKDAYKVRVTEALEAHTQIKLKEIMSSDDFFVFEFDVEYVNVPDNGTIYVTDGGQLGGGLDMGDEITISDPFGETESWESYSSYCSFQGPSSRFGFQIPKKWFENRRDNKIIIEFELLEIVYQKTSVKGSSSIGIIGGADGPTSVIVSDENSEKEIKRLKKKYPDFFNVDVEGGITVFVTKLAQQNYRCYLSADSAAVDPQKILSVGEFATIEEMKLILSSYDFSDAKVTVKPFRHMLSSYIGDDTEYDPTNITLLLGLEHYNKNQGEFEHIYGKFYKGVIDTTSEFRAYGLYYKDESTNKYLLVDNTGSETTQFVVRNEALYYLSQGRLKSVSLNGDFRLTVYAGGFYLSEEHFSIERIELIQDGRIYCKTDKLDKRKYEPLYLKIEADGGYYEEITKNDVPADAAQFEAISENIESVLGTSAENILVKDFRITYSATGNIDEAIFNVWIYKGTKNGEDFWTEGNVLVAFDNTVFFNVINEEITLLFEYNPKADGSLLTIDKIIEKAEIAILGSVELENAETVPKQYLLTFSQEEYVEYVAKNNEGVRFFEERNGELVSGSRPRDLTPQSYQIPGKVYFILVPRYEKGSVKGFVFEETEEYSSGAVSVLLFGK